MDLKFSQVPLRFFLNTHFLFPYATTQFVLLVYKMVMYLDARTACNKLLITNYIMVSVGSCFIKANLIFYLLPACRSSGHFLFLFIIGKLNFFHFSKLYAFEPENTRICIQINTGCLLEAATSDE